MIRNREGAMEIRRWWVASRAATKDLQELLDKAQVPIFSLDVNGRVRQWNMSMFELTGLEPEKVMGNLFLDMVSSECKDAVQAKMSGRPERRSSIQGQAGGRTWWRARCYASRGEAQTARPGIPAAEARGESSQQCRA
eukprot:gb/GFBE01038155.1/.p1 GENE.gb/GFBE01038155.1/~~gb/GFBE01038155.1/.p1  ORF type:complete len:138 (+),score=28.00 gb/GFBE01038155.1/:1-414(+)